MDKTTPILIVDDYRTMLRIIRNLLKQLGFEHLEEASDGRTALAKLREGRFGLVICDGKMQPMDGFELLRTVRSDPALKSLPFIMVTAGGNAENVIAAKEAGASDYIVKPFNAQTLRTTIESVLCA